MIVHLAPPYSALAPTYDRALGVTSFARAKRAFEFAARRYGIQFESAADVGCGTGLFACYLTRCWQVPVFAVDRSADMLRVARGRCGDPDVQFLEQDIRNLHLPRPVDLITANFDTVNHLLRGCDLARAFRRIAANLRLGGHFVFDVITTTQAPLRAYVRRLPAAGRQLFQDIHWDPLKGLLSIAVVQRWPGRRAPTVEFHAERAYSPGLVGRLLLDAGFTVRGVHDAISLRWAMSCSPRLFVVAQKHRAVA
jgi:SAM-dependent methyltransferase